MNREIKFRAWDKKKREMCFLTTNAFTELMFNDCLRVLQEDYELMQYIGLKDCNGKDIYDGDIVIHRKSYWTDDNKRHDYWREKRTCAVWLNSPCWETGSSQSVSDGECGAPEPDDIKVIGNIYEHGHLLDNTDTKV